MVKTEDIPRTPLAQSPETGARTEWRVSDSEAGYQEALDVMETRVTQISEGTAPELVWLLEHPPIYTAGTSASPSDLLTPARFPVFSTGRGGQYTYHGPGQRIAYVMLDLKCRKPDVRAFIHALENWIIAVLSHYGVEGEVRPDRVGVWVRRPELGAGREDKIAAIGIRLRQWITFHGISLNINPDLEHFSGIVPCGVTGYGVTSLKDLGISTTVQEVDELLRIEFERHFGPVLPSGAILVR